jgi:hypothetical protein
LRWHDIWIQYMQAQIESLSAEQPLIGLNDWKLVGKHAA